MTRRTLSLSSLTSARNLQRNEIAGLRRALDRRGPSAPRRKYCVFDLDPSDEKDEDSGHRSILGLERLEFPRGRKAAGDRSPEPRAPRLPVPEPEEEESGRQSILKLEHVESSPEWRAAVAAGTRRGASVTSRPPYPLPGAPLDGEEPDRPSMLGLERIEFSSEWRAAVAASPLRQAVATRKSVAPSRSLFSETDEEDSRHEFLLGLERSEFALGRKPAVSASPSTDPAVLPPPDTRKRLPPSRERLAQRDLLSLRAPAVLPQVDVPQFERDLMLRSEEPIPVERAILLSLAAHILLILLMLWVPLGVSGSARRNGLLAGLLPEPPPPDNKIPILFRSAPGPQRENSNPSDLSDKTRRAGGGDRSRPKSDTPFSPERSGIEGLAQGRNAKAARAKPSPATRQAEGGRETAAEKAPPTADAFKISPPGSGSPSPERRSSQNPTQLAGLDEAIRQAAREVEASGENGAGFPNPDGGFVDTGGLSFESTWFEWGDYWETFVRRVKLHWKVPIDLMMLGAKGRVTITMAILADGRLADLKVVRPSATIPFNFAAEQALETSSPFRPLPKELLQQVPGKDRERVTVTFFYNMRPGHESDAEQPPKPNPR